MNRALVDDEMVGGQHQAHRLGIAPGHPGGGQAAGRGGVAPHGLGQHVFHRQLGKLPAHLVQVQTAGDHQHFSGLHQRSQAVHRLLQQAAFAGEAKKLLGPLLPAGRPEAGAAAPRHYHRVKIHWSIPRKFQARAMIPTAKQ